jgi:cysteinyl-tRNA synthetase
MSRRILGETFDIHGGGLDLVFPHHENEIAQSECCHGKPMVKYWMHNGLMRAGAGGKMGGRGEREAEQATVDTKISRSKGAGGLADLIAEQGGQTLRFFLLRTHYRSTIVYGTEGLAEAQTALESFTRFFERYERIAGQNFYELSPIRRRQDGELASGQNPLLEEVARRRDAYLAKMDDDFNTGAAISELFELLHVLNKFIDQHDLENPAGRQGDHLTSLRRGTATLRELTALLGLFREAPNRSAAAQHQLIEPLLALLVDLRNQSRQRKDLPWRIRSAGDWGNWASRWKTAKTVPFGACRNVPTRIGRHG